MSETKTAVLLDQELDHEVIPDFDHSLTAVAPTEMHAITFVLMAGNEGPFSKKDLMKIFYEVQGDNPVWQVAPNLNFRYSQTAFTREGLAETRTESRELFNRREPVDVLVTDLTLAPEEAKGTLAICGVLFDWGLGEARVSQRQVFGSTHFKDGNEAARGATLHRRDVLQAILDSPGISESELTDGLGLGQGYLSSILREFVENKILIRDSASDWDNRQFTLTGKGYRHIAIKRENLKPEAQAVYDMADVLAVTGREEVSAAELFDLIIANNPGLDPSVLRGVIDHALVDDIAYQQGGQVKTTKNIPVLLSSGTFNQGKKTKFSVRPDLVESLESLLTNLKTVEDGDPEAVAHYADVARKIVATPEQVNTLILKAKTSSPHRNRQDNEEFLRQVKDVFGGREVPMSVVDLARELRKRGTKMSVERVRRNVNKLEEAGRLTTDKLSHDPRLQKLSTFVVSVS